MFGRAVPSSAGRPVRILAKIETQSINPACGSWLITTSITPSTSRGRVSSVRP